MTPYSWMGVDVAGERRRVAVVVDGYLTGRHLQPAFARLGLDTVHVQSTPELLTSMFAPDLSVYLDHIVHYGQLSDTVATLEKYAPMCVVPGMEPGVTLADALSEALGVPSNGTALSPARRDKYQMIETLRANGLRCADQFTSGDPEALVAWARARGDYPVVVKPLQSAATDHVRVCHTPDQVRAAAAAVLASRDIYDQANPLALVQSYLAGTEYVVNMVSCAGHRYVTDTWRYHKRLVDSAYPVYDIEELLTPEVEPVAELIEYTGRVLDALGIQFGPSHAEVMLTADGPALVEVGARVTGHLQPGFHDASAGHNQADLTALAYARPAEFIERFSGGVYRKRREAVCCLTPTALNGTVAAIDEAVLEEIRALPTVYAIDVKVQPGSRIRPTTDLYSSTLRVYLCGESSEAIRADHARLLDLADHAFDLAPA
jgi:hypothetical protein